MAQPFVLMIAGPNGSGKTELTQWLRQNDIDLGQYLSENATAVMQASTVPGIDIDLQVG